MRERGERAAHLVVASPSSGKASMVLVAARIVAVQSMVIRLFTVGGAARPRTIAGTRCRPPGSPLNENGQLRRPLVAVKIIASCPLGAGSAGRRWRPPSSRRRRATPGRHRARPVVEMSDRGVFGTFPRRMRRRVLKAEEERLRVPARNELDRLV